MPTVIIPINSSPNQKFKCKVPVGEENINLIFEISFNEVSTYWTMDISLEQTKILACAPLIPEDFPSNNILKQYEYLGIGSAHIVPRSSINDDEWPFANNLGSKWALVWSD